MNASCAIQHFKKLLDSVATRMIALELHANYTIPSQLHIRVGSKKRKNKKRSSSLAISIKYSQFTCKLLLST